MRLHISGVSAAIGTDELRDKFAAVGRILDLYRPEPRQLGSDIIPREYVFIEVDEESRGRAHKVASAVCLSLHSHSLERLLVCLGWGTLLSGLLTYLILLS
jgi:hypothetical protein